MLLVDPRIGSKDLLVPLQRFGVKAELAVPRLDYGDFAFVGRGISGAPILLSVELKETVDLITSLRSGRYEGHQLRGLLSTYDHTWLLTEGIWRGDPESGALQVFSQGWRLPRTRGKKPMELTIQMREIESRLLTLGVRAGISLHHCSTRADTIRWLSVLYHWFTDKDMDEHRSHLSFAHPFMDRALLEEPSMCREMLAKLPGIGWERSRAAEEHFKGSVRGFVNASVEEWTQIPGIGKKTATKIDQSLQ
jgi:ERCC4-type nuclease